MSQTTNNDAGAQKLATVLKPLLDEVRKELREHNTATSQEVLIQIAALNSRLDVIEKLVSGPRKQPTARAEKKTAEVATPTGGEATEPAPPAAQPAKNFAVNKLVYFRDQFKTNPEYRAKYVSQELQQLMDADPTIASKNKPDQKLVAQATFCWNYFKNNAATNPQVAAVAESIEKEFQAAKQQHEAASKQSQLVAEPRTPEQGK